MEHHKKQRKSRIPKKQCSFFNQVTIHVNCEKIVNVKLFNNGKIQMTGLKYENHGEKVLDILLPYLKEIDNTNTQKILINQEGIYYTPFNIALINSDFSIGYKVKRDVVHREIVDAGMYYHMNLVFIQVLILNIIIMKIQIMVYVNVVLCVMERVWKR